MRLHESHLMPSSSCLCRSLLTSSSLTSYKSVTSSFKRCLPDWSLGDGPFRQYTETRLIGFSVQQMYDVASNVQHYHEFVPWCMKSELVRKISDKESDWMLQVGFPPLLEQYVSRVTCSPPDFVKSECSDGKTLQYLENIWVFRPGDRKNSCMLEFYVGFQFTNLFYAKLSALFFAQVVNQMTTAFEKRATVLHGPPSFQSKTVKMRSRWWTYIFYC